MQHRLLLAEDDSGIADPLERALTREGFAVEVVADGAEAAMRGIDGDHDLLVLDVGLPTLDGLEVCRRVRAVRPRVPVLILTARAEEPAAYASIPPRAAHGTTTRSST
jgi:DNA-binding response OmpR family regulator